jgi:hypothetical protein
LQQETQQVRAARHRRLSRRVPTQLQDNRTRARPKRGQPRQRKQVHHPRAPPTGCAQSGATAAAQAANQRLQGHVGHSRPYPECTAVYGATKLVLPVRRLLSYSVPCLSRCKQGAAAVRCALRAMPNSTACAHAPQPSYTVQSTKPSYAA